MPIVLLLQAPAPEAQKIEALIRAIEALQGQAVFLRNGSEHDAKAAGDHLRLKWKNAGRRVKSAADFIRTCGTGSSLSGQPYKIRYRDGRELASADFLWTELKKLDPSVR
ncbi:DUF5329 family protein [Geothrix fermentans]|uniref:DUF5329 family protein n=1 Tax=Geothrix fermentans TaxID=44676 RepID=UPI000402A18D|nr:DUF5329 family protein [Geothrix fermentans]